MNGSDLIQNGVIYLGGAVVSDDYAARADGRCFSPTMVRDALGQFAGDVTLRVNSGGGDPYEGEAIRSALKGHAGTVTMIVEGVAASAASFILMAADVISMTRGSQIMIHDPSTIGWGNPEELAKASADLDKLANIYADVYATRTNNSPEQIRDLMKETTFMGPDQALELGFVDRIEDEDVAADVVMSIDAAQGAHQQAIGVYSMSIAPPTPENSEPETPAPVAEQEETPMPNTAPETTMNNDAAIQDAVSAERARVKGVRDMAKPFMSSGALTEADVDAMIDQGVTAEAAGTKFMNLMASRDAPNKPAARQNRVGTEAVEHQREGMVMALMGDFTEQGAEYRGLRLKSLAMNLAGEVRGYDDAENVRRGMLSQTSMAGAVGVSDFGYITGQVMHRTLAAAYARRNHTWKRLCGTPIKASDFREHTQVSLGGDFTLKEAGENGEFGTSTVDDKGEGVKVRRKGANIKLTFEAIMNDDMSALTRLPQEFAIAASNMEASMVWAIIRANAALKNGKALFHDDHNNLLAAAKATDIGVAGVGAMRKLMWEQVAMGAKEGTEDFLAVTPDLLIVPPALETKALQFATAITPTKSEDSNPYRGTLEPIVAPHLGAAASGGSDTAFYLASSDLPPVMHAYLDGHEAPSIVTQEHISSDYVKLEARHIMGAAPAEPRGIVKNAGK